MPVTRFKDFEVHFMGNNERISLRNRIEHLLRLDNAGIHVPGKIPARDRYESTGRRRASSLIDCAQKIVTVKSHDHGYMPLGARDHADITVMRMHQVKAASLKTLT